MEKFYPLITPSLMKFFRITPDPITNFFLGTFILTFIGVIIGEISISIAFLLNRHYVASLNKDLVKWNNLSIEALKEGDKKRYQEANDKANKAFGKLFFLSFTYSAASLWPSAFLLGWMNYHFGSIEIPLPFSIPFAGISAVGYTFIFIPLCILSFVIFSMIKPHLPYFSYIHGLLSKHEEEKSKLRSFSELMDGKIRT